MKKAKILLWVVAAVIIGTGAAYFYAEKSSSLLSQKLQPYISQLTPVVESITPYTESIEIPHENLPEVATLTQRGKELTDHVGTVLGETVSEADAEQQPLHERAVEYGQYIYCKGIVEEYENKHDTSKPSEWSLDRISRWLLSLLRNVTTRQNKAITV